MAEKIELQIVADNADYITKTKQVEDATKSMQRSVQEGCIVTGKQIGRAHV